MPDTFPPSRGVLRFTTRDLDEDSTPPRQDVFNIWAMMMVFSLFFGLSLVTSYSMGAVAAPDHSAMQLHAQQRKEERMKHFGPLLSQQKLNMKAAAGHPLLELRAKRLGITVDTDTQEATEETVEAATTTNDGAVVTTPRSVFEDRRLARLQKYAIDPATLESPATHIAEPVVPKRNPYNKAGVYLTASSTADDEFIQYTIDRLLEVGGSTVVFDVKGYWVYFNTTSEFAHDIQIVVPHYELPEIIAKFKERDIFTIGRFIAIKDEKFAELAPEVRLRNPKTGTLVYRDWVDPSHPKVLEYNWQIMCDLAKSGIDEVNLDYIRLSSNRPYSTGHSRDDKAEKLLTFVKKMRDAIDTCGPDTILGVSTYAILGWSYEQNVETIGQDVARYAPYVDVISPMAYPSTFSYGYYNSSRHPGNRSYFLVYRTMTGYRDVLGPEHEWKLRPWIQSYGMETHQVKAQMDAVVDSGFCGFTFWSANNKYGPTYRAFTQWKAPERCYSDTVSMADPKWGLML